MGNHHCKVGQLRLEDVLSSSRSSHGSSVNRTGRAKSTSKLPSGSFIYIWRFYPGSGSVGTIRYTAVRLASFPQFSSQESYLVLHICSDSSGDCLPDVDDKPATTPPTASFKRLVSSVNSAILPDCLSAALAFDQSEPFAHPSLSSSLYVWNGRASTALTRAVILAKAFEIDSALRDTSRDLDWLTTHKQLTSLSSVFTEDVDSVLGGLSSPNGSTSSNKNNHLFDVIRGKKAASRQPTAPFLMASATEGTNEVWEDMFSPTDDDGNDSHNASVESCQSLTASSKKKRSSKRKSRPSRSSKPSKPHSRPGAPAVPGLSLRGGRKMPGGFSFKIPNMESLGIGGGADAQELLRKRDKLMLFDPICSKITDQLFLCSNTVAQDHKLLQSEGVTHIINCAGTICPDYYPNKFEYHTFHLADGKNEDISCVFYEVIDWLETVLADPSHKAAVHCQQGVSRSSTILICYLMWKRQTPFAETHAAVKAIRGTSSPNSGFTVQLLRWWKRSHASIDQPRMYRIVPHCVASPQLIVMKWIDVVSADSLDPRGSVLVQTSKCIYVWIGAECHPKLREYASTYVSRLQRFEHATSNVEVVEQGSESDAFWSALTGGKKEVKQIPALDNVFVLLKLRAPSGAKAIEE